jgi:hypothetical protein
LASKSTTYSVLDPLEHGERIPPSGFVVGLQWSAKPVQQKNRIPKIKPLYHHHKLFSLCMIAA